MWNPPFEMLDHALWYAEHGYQVLPLYEERDRACACGKSDCRSPAKHPRTAHGVLDASSDANHVRAWWSQWPRANIGVATGGGLVVVDVDPRNGGEVPSDLPRTPTVYTGGGGSHHWFAGSTTMHSLGPGIDVKTEGGYVVVPPSTHVSGRPYAWDLDAHIEDIPLATFPRDVAPKPASAPVPDGPIEEGQRDNSLARIAGSMRRQGADKATILIALRDINKRRCKPPLPDADIERISRSIARYKPERTNRVLVAGTHARLRDGDPQTFEVSESEFASDALEKLPPGTVYRRSRVLGEILGGTFAPLTRERAQVVLARHVRFGTLTVAQPKRARVGRPGGDEDAPPLEERCKREDITPARCGIVIAEGWTSKHVRELRRLTSYPVLLPDGRIATGWDAATGTYVDSPEIPVLAPDLAVLGDLLVDYPFAGSSDWAAYVGLLLTVIMRPAIDGPIPMHLVESSLPGTGKGLLAVDLLGSLFLRRPCPVTQFGRDETEVAKQITAIVLQASPIVCLDNLGRHLDSPALASLLTAAHWSGRLLGSTATIDVPVDAVVVGTANNPSATEEIARRIVPIRLQPTGPRPEERGGYRHPPPRVYVPTVRERVLGVLLGMIRAWVSAGRPAGSRTLGSYEVWASVIGGVLEMHGLSDWLSDRSSWVQGAAPERDDVEAFVSAWHALRGSQWSSAAELLEVARGSWPEVWERHTSDAGRARALGLRIAKLANRPVGAWVIRRSGRLYRLES